MFHVKHPAGAGGEKQAGKERRAGRTRRRAHGVGQNEPRAGRGREEQRTQNRPAEGQENAHRKEQKSTQKEGYKHGKFTKVHSEEVS